MRRPGKKVAVTRPACSLFSSAARMAPSECARPALITCGVRDASLGAGSAVSCGVFRAAREHEGYEGGRDAAEMRPTTASCTRSWRTPTCAHPLPILGELRHVAELEVELARPQEGHVRQRLALTSAPLGWSVSRQPRGLRASV